MLEEVDAIHIRGGNALFGETTIQGSKNAVLPVMAAALLINDVCTIENCPRIQDVEHMKNLLQSLGCKVKRSNRAITVDASCLTDLALQQEAIRNENVTCMRSSIMLLGAMLGRIGEVSLAYPGGCVIGERPIDLHIRSLKKMGVEFYEEEGYFRAYTRGLKGAVIRLPVASVGATENIVLAAVKARGVTVLQNAAKEPEIISLCEFLTKAGAIIEGTGTDTLLIKGLEELHGITYRIPSDRIVAGTYLFSVLGTGPYIPAGCPGAAYVCRVKKSSGNGSQTCCFQRRNIGHGRTGTECGSLYEDGDLSGVPDRYAVPVDGGSDESIRLKPY